MFFRISLALLLIGFGSATSKVAQPASGPHDVGSLQLAAEEADTRGQSAAAAYLVLASALQEMPTHSAQRIPILKRGLKVAIRDGDAARAQWFASNLKTAGEEQALSLLGKTPERSRHTVIVPGGMKALMAVARGRAPDSPERFFAEYARTVLAQHPSVGPGRNEVVDRIRDHFTALAGLQTLGTRAGLRATLSLSVSDEAGRRHAAQVLDLLGWQLEMRGESVAVSASEDPSKSRRQIAALALGIDELAMQNALQTGRSFQFTISDDFVPVLLDERLWLEQSGRFRGGFAEALVCDVELARTYAGLSELDEESAASLVSALGLKTLLQRDYDRLYYFSSALAVSGNRVLLPGGDGAAEAWSILVKASPLQPRQFLSNLLQADDGRLLAFFFSLSQLDWAHQQFFTRSPKRTARFYELFRNSYGVRAGVERGLRECPFADFLGEVPIDSNGRVLFPGGPEVWLISRGDSSLADTGRMLRRLSGVEIPAMEDDILIRLARTRYMGVKTVNSELDNFLAVARIDSHRERRLDAKTALLLAQQFNRYRHLWPYFSVFTGLGYEEYSEFFTVCENLSRYPALHENNSLGQLGSLLELISLLRQAGRIDQDGTTELFRLLCTRLISAGDSAAVTAASIEITRELLKRASANDSVADPDATMRDLLSGTRAPFRLNWGARTYEIDDAARRRLKYERVLDLQRVPRLSTIFRLNDYLDELALSQPSRSDTIPRIQETVAELPDVDVPGSLPLRGVEKENLGTLGTRNLRKLAAALGQASAGEQSLPEITRHFMAALAPHVRLALSGIVYACYLDPDDLLVSEDTLFVRKHQFVTLRHTVGERTVFAQKELAGRSGAGSNLTGCFAGFGVIAGQIAGLNADYPGGAAEFYVAAQLSALRITNWQQATDADLRLTGLKIRSAREWIVESALRSEIRSELSQATLGLLSLARRSQLLRSLQARDWSAVWRSVTLGDLYHLGEELLDRYPQRAWASPTLDALRAAAADSPAQPAWLGQDLQELMACSHTHFARLAPYERYEGSMLPVRLAERASEFKLYVAEFADRVGIPARALEALTEPLARAVFGRLELTDRRDWRAVLGSFSRLDESMIEGAIAKSWSKTDY